MGIRSVLVYKEDEPHFHYNVLNKLEPEHTVKGSMSKF